MKKLVLPVLIVIEMIILGVVLVSGVSERRDNAVTAALPPLEEWSSRYVEFKDGRWSVSDRELTEEDRATEDLTAAAAAEEGIEGSYPVTVITSLSDETRFFATLTESPAITIPRGSYTLTVNYSASVDQYVALRIYDEELSGSVTADGVTSPVSPILANPAKLSKNKNVLIYHFSAVEDTENVSVVIPYNYYGDLSISSISLEPNMNGVKSRLFLLFTLFVLLDAAVFDLGRKGLIKKYALSVTGVVVIAALSSLPLLLPGIVIGHDENFHLVRIEGLAEALSSGQFPVRMQSLWMDGFGYPVSVYYGDLFLYFPAVLRLLGFSVNSAYKLFILALNLMTAAVCFLCMKGIFKKDGTALVLTAGYVTASYRLVDIYARSAVGEALAFIMYPILALALWRMYGDVDKRQRIIENAILISLGMSGLLFSHTLSVAMTAAFMAVVVLIFIKKTFTPVLLKTWIGGVAGTCLLSAGFLIPFLDYQINVSTNSSVNEGEELIQWGGAFIYQYLMVFAQPFGSNSAELSERMNYSPGLILMIACVAAIVHLVIRHAKKPTVIMLVLSVLALWLASDLFPYDLISEYITPAVATIQFPWRFVGIACISLTLLLGTLIMTIDERSKDRGSTYLTDRWIPIVFLICAIISSLVFFIQYSANDYRGNYRDTAELDNYNVTSFFLREGIADDEPLDMSYPEMENIESYELRGRDGNTLHAYVKSTGSGYLELPVFYYPNYHMYLADGSEADILDGSHHLIGLNLPNDYEGEITLIYREPLLWRVSEMISLVTVIAMLFYGIRGYKRSRQTDCFAEVML